MVGAHLPAAVWAGVRAADHPYALSALPKALPAGRYALGDGGFSADASAAAAPANEARPRLQGVIERWPATNEALYSARLVVDSFLNEQDWAKIAHGTWSEFGSGT